MAEKKIDVEIFEVEDDFNTLVLTTEDGSEVEFYEMGGIEYDDKFFIVLQPVEEIEGLEEGDVVIFEVTDRDSEEQNFIPVDDEALDELLFEAFIKEWQEKYPE